MSRPCWVLVLGSLGILAWSSGPVWANPKSTTFPDVMAQSTTIAVARYVNGPPNGNVRQQPKVCSLELLDVLKGDVQPGRLNVTFEDNPYVSTDFPEFIVFLNKDFVWRFVAVPLVKGGKVAEGALDLHGFYDFNAHYVSPGLVTRKLLETFIKDSTLVYQFRGPLYFPVKGEVGWKASAIEIEGTYDALKKSGTVKGLPPMKGLPAEPEFRFRGLQSAGVELQFTGGPHRGLHLQASVAGLDRKSDTLLLKWFATAPDFLTQKDFESYLADPTKVNSHYRVTLNARPISDKEKPKLLTLKLENSGLEGHLEGWTDKPLPSRGSSWTDKWIDYSFPLPTGEELVVHLEYVPLPADAEVMTWTFQKGLLYRLNTGDLAGSLLLRQNKEDRLHATCTATLEGIFYEKSN
jgi:hypothetical protein